MVLQIAREHTQEGLPHPPGMPVRLTLVNVKPSGGAAEKRDLPGFHRRIDGLSIS
jgi:hypothetical protein